VNVYVRYLRCYILRRVSTAYAQAVGKDAQRVVVEKQTEWAFVHHEGAGAGTSAMTLMSARGPVPAEAGGSGGGRGGGGVPPLRPVMEAARDGGKAE
jgi:hypothetical protein